MVKEIVARVSSRVLIVVGWVCFVVGAVVPEPLSLKLVLLGAARVLPQALPQASRFEMTITESKEFLLDQSGWSALTLVSTA